ncbi:MAG: UDP-N-acetylmuramoyl-tripeptide--D-alanyl-D-alanine ligase [Coprothermobacterota bacterium]|nr:UDP-N-acetylmuramoyl-tripeptide--D-alanyl-D-alanine ligase [Coprothermobacterota bacterium]
MELTLVEIASIVGGTTQGAGSVKPRALALDSRLVLEGDLFAALRGERTDGHLYLEQARRRGAVAALVEATPSVRPEGLSLIVVPSCPSALLRLAAALRERFLGPVVAITGTVGKTTTKEMIALLLESAGPVLKSEGNWNTELGLPLALSYLTPAHRFLVQEIGLQKPGDVRLLARLLRPTTAIITEIGPAHLEYLGSVERILEEKWELVRNLAPGGLAVLNADNALLRFRKEEIPHALWFGLREPADFRSLEIRQEGAGTWLTVATPYGEGQFWLPFVGDHLLRDFLGTLAVVLSLGLSLEQAGSGITRFQLPPGRGCLVEREGIFWVDDSYNANPTSTEAALATFCRRATGRRLVVLGDMLELGESAAILHRNLGGLIPVGCEGLFLFGDLSRHTAKGALENGYPRERIRHFETIESLQDSLRSTLRPGDWVLLKGSRGMHLEKILEERESS